MTAYYNENDAGAVAWLRELIKRGLIADGIVDDRSIVRTYSPMTLRTLPSATSSPALVGGPLPCAWPGGLMTGRCGPDPARARISPVPVNKRASMANDTCGPRSFASLRSGALTQSLGNRLQVRLPLRGLTLYVLTWKMRITPAGRAIWQLQALARPTSGKGCTGWPTAAQFVPRNGVGGNSR